MTRTELSDLVTEYLSKGGSVTKPRRPKKARGLKYFNVTRRSKKIGKLNFHGQRY